MAPAHETEKTDVKEFFAFAKLVERRAPLVKS